MSDAFADHQHALGFAFADPSPVGATAELPGAAVRSVPRLIDWGAAGPLLPRVHVDPSGAAVLFGAAELTLGFAGAGTTVPCLSSAEDPIYGFAMAALPEAADPPAMLPYRFVDPLAHAPLPGAGRCDTDRLFRPGLLHLTLLAGRDAAVAAEGPLTAGLAEFATAHAASATPRATLRIRSAEELANTLTGRTFHHLVCEFGDGTAVDVCAPARAGVADPYPAGARLTAAMLTTGAFEPAEPHPGPFHFAEPTVLEHPRHAPAAPPRLEVYTIAGRPPTMELTSTIPAALGFVPGDQSAVWTTLFARDTGVDWAVREYLDDSGAAGVELTHGADGFAITLDAVTGHWRPVAYSGAEGLWEFAATEAAVFDRGVDLARWLPGVPDPDAAHPGLPEDRRPHYGDPWTVAVRLHDPRRVDWALDGGIGTIMCTATWRGRPLHLLLPATVAEQAPFAIDGAVLVGTIRYCGPDPAGATDEAPGAAQGPSLPEWAPEPPAPREAVRTLAGILADPPGHWRLMELMEAAPHTARDRLARIAAPFGLRVALEHGEDQTGDRHLLLPDEGAGAVAFRELEAALQSRRDRREDG